MENNTAMPDKLAEQVEELRGLEALATPGPWADQTCGPSGKTYIAAGSWPRGATICELDDENASQNANLVVAMRNALLSLLTALEQYKRDAERLDWIDRHAVGNMAGTAFTVRINCKLNGPERSLRSIVDAALKAP